MGNSLPSPALSLDENHVYVTTTGNLLYSLDTSSGVVELTTGLTIGDGEMTPSPAVDTSGDIVVGSTDGFLISFAANLTVNWSNNLAIHSSGSAVCDARRDGWRNHLYWDGRRRGR